MSHTYRFAGTQNMKEIQEETTIETVENPKRPQGIILMISKFEFFAGKNHKNTTAIM